ncbi:hypothetical protein HZF05_03405 [Sphingomonas sp. CGMCC 1.13654]|uniref:Tetratricopeptide repeat protein n=1 Tax=Sphingomonas chungangi TaxID=2683589 RepID=A0A838L259_9SPHN|nr:hypothetical protein [Sphingomonas chungangi]MBA2933137.1 hypothetical protein [Sphingomonas chungangi]MVW56757.1 hypothetical protein [Sphingomonas chungangi]
MNTPSTDMGEIMRAVAMVHGGDRDAARRDLLRLWNEKGEYGTPLQRCTIAHFLADTEDDAKDELAWDLLALEAATGSQGDEDLDPVDPSLAGFLPSLHLNVGDAYRRLGDPARASRHAAVGLARIAHLNHDGYGDMVRTGLNRLRDRLGAAGID